MEYKVTEKDLIGDIKDFPIEVVQRMADCQLEQDNKACIDVLQGPGVDSPTDDLIYHSEE